MSIDDNSNRAEGRIFSLSLFLYKMLKHYVAFVVKMLKTTLYGNNIIIGEPQNLFNKNSC